MKDILELIKKEDRKNPLTDEEISKILGITRGEVIKLRDSLNIGDSRERRKEILESEMKRVLESSPHISEREMTKRLNEIGFDISRNIVSRYIKNMQEQILFYQQENENINTELNKNEKEQSNTVINSAFSGLIGAYGSLKSKVELNLENVKVEYFVVVQA
ncbi:hypothetical protein CPJCM30710_21080 [Clostridium polyendosporum]|uniref:RNA polymerase sigma factor 54 DNA-binding domain-containing protein n=2 Tax=Clostridium polyendosporum TaxID=69208 RepID=A0A919RZQ1_9CLOT|nr:hypothetical protein CPJCM30710_21080 [Clostridium polyendosporum]